MKKYILGILCIVIICASVISSCAGPAETTEIDEGKYGGILKIGSQAPQLLSPGYPAGMASNSDVDSQASFVCLETLLNYNENFELIPGLATEWKYSDEGKTLTLKLREGVKFHDGSDFNAEVVKWNMENYTLAGKREFAKIDSINIVDNYTLQLNLSSFDCMLVPYLAENPGRIISKLAFDTHGADWCAMNPVGTGAFKFVSWVPDVSLKYEKFDEYWQEGLPYLDGVEIVLFADEMTSYLALRRGEIDMVKVGMESDAQDLEKDGYIISTSMLGPQLFLAGDSKNPDSPFADIKVRQAISYALDLEAIGDSLGCGYWKTTNQWAVPGTMSYNPDVVGYPYNPEKAKQLLAEAGYEDGLDITLYYCTRPFTDMQMTSIQSYLEEVGINGKLEPLQITGYVSQWFMGPGWEDGILQVLGGQSPNIFNIIATFSAGNPQLPSFARPTEVEELYAQALSTVDDEARMALYHEINKIAIDEYCMATPLWAQPNMVAKQTWVHDDLYCIVPPRNQYLSPATWLEKE